MKKLVKNLRTLVLSCLLVCLMTTVGFATPIVTGTQLQISPLVANLQEGNLTGNTGFHLIYEGTFSLSGVKVDVLGNAPGVYDQVSDVPAFLVNKPTLADGTYQSWIVHSDPLNSGDHFYYGTATFEADIVGLMLLSNTLSAADGCADQDTNPNPPGHCTNMDPINAFYDGVNYMRYSWGSDRGLELGTGTGTDRIEYISPRTLAITQFNTSSVVDEVRILTEIPAVPEPTSLLLLGLGLVGLAGIRRKFKSSKS